MRYVAVTLDVPSSIPAAGVMRAGCWQPPGRVSRNEATDYPCPCIKFKPSSDLQYGAGENRAITYGNHTPVFSE